MRSLLIETDKTDWCPLNFQEDLPSQQDTLNLQTLNSISSSLQLFWQKETGLKQDRVELSQLMEKLFQA